MKDYIKWHDLKRKIESSDKKELFREREIWWCSLGENVGYEQDGKNKNFERPVLVLKKFNHEVFLGLPLTSSQKEGKYYFPLQVGETSGSIILSQARLLSVKRLERKLESVGRGKFQKITEAYIKLFST